MKAKFILLVAVCLAAAGAQAEEPAANAHAELQALVTAQFGETFTVFDEMESPLFTADLNGDGVLDAVIISRMDNPLLDQKEFSYKVVDPYHGHFGFGDPSITLQFGVTPGRVPLALLIIHGAGEQAWRAATPREKFVIVNLPFERLTMGRAMYRKRVRQALMTEEGGQRTASLFWDGRRYRWEPNFDPNN
jgi:hypothetical protein